MKSTQYIENRINNLLAEAASSEIRLSEVEYESAILASNDTNLDEVIELNEKKHELTKSFIWNLKSLYLSVLTYLDERKLNNCINIFLKFSAMILTA